jgi:hypothetical protein
MHQHRNHLHEVSENSSSETNATLSIACCIAARSHAVSASSWGSALVNKCVVHKDCKASSIACQPSQRSHSCFSEGDRIRFLIPIKSYRSSTCNAPSLSLSIGFRVDTWGCLQTALRLCESCYHSHSGNVTSNKQVSVLAARDEGGIDAYDVSGL